MTTHWPAVARAINQRMAELDLSQRELIERSQVSKATVREIQHNTVQRRRSDRTLEALSAALAWHPGHLAAVLHDRRPPTIGEPLVRSDDDVAGRLAAVEYQVQKIADRLDGIDALGDRLDDINTKVDSLAGAASAARQPRRERGS